MEFSLSGVRNAPLDIWGGARVFVGCKLFFVMHVRQSFFNFRCRTEIYIFVVCLSYYVRYHLVVFLVNIFFINFDNNFFFLTTFPTNFFFLSPPPPQISNGAPLRWLSILTSLFPPSSLIGRPTPIECDAGVTMWR